LAAENAGNAPKVAVFRRNVPVSRSFPASDPAGAAGFLIFLVFLWQKKGAGRPQKNRDGSLDLKRSIGTNGGQETS
jgi:hypothetical protein